MIAYVQEQREIIFNFHATTYAVLIIVHILKQFFFCVHIELFLF